MKLVLLLLLLGISSQTIGQARLSGTVTDARTGETLAGTTVVNTRTDRRAVTNNLGRFSIPMPMNTDSLAVSSVGYVTRYVSGPFSATVPLTLTLQPATTALDEVVVSTGYYEVPIERATGSFTHLDNALLNRGPSTDILSRLDGITNGYQVDRRLEGTIGYTPQIRLRGISTLNSSTDPLIVVDNFPYEGDIANINPNDVENVTVLKDAAAASIWGSRAGNGVIVITTKKGALNRPIQIGLNSNVTAVEKPDVFYSPAYIPSRDFLNLEREWFDNGLPVENVWTPLSPATEIFIRQRDGLITGDEATRQLADLSRQDVRRDIDRYYYRTGLNQQYALNLSGGTPKLSYYISGGIDQNRSTSVGDRMRRVTINSNTIYRPIERLSFKLGLAYSENATESTLSAPSDLRMAQRGIAPYLRLSDDEGRSLPITKDYRLSYVADAEGQGLLNWDYIPLDEFDRSQSRGVSAEVRMDAAVQYTLTKGLSADVKYQYQRITGDSRSLRGRESYYVRDLVNRYTQADGARVFPEGSVLALDNSTQIAHSGRAQLNYNREWERLHRLTALAGTEWRQIQSRGKGFSFFGYDDDVLTYYDQYDFLERYPIRPQGTAYMQKPMSSLSDFLDRFVSYYGNAAYTYRDSYTLSGSVRWDASNLFGVKTNQQGVPLWSVGGSWVLTNDALRQISWLPYLRMRATYGYNGNVNKSVTAYTTARYLLDPATGGQRASIQSPGNPQLKWEEVETFNLGLDIGLFNNRLRGSVEYYRKNGRDLLADIELPPSTGFLGNYLVNYADIRTSGIDIELNTQNLNREVRWQTTLLVNYAYDRVTGFSLDPNSTGTVINFASGNNITPLVGKPRYMLMSLPWHGLDPETGDPWVMENGSLIKNYAAYQRSLTVDSLTYQGPAVAPWYGSIRNQFAWRGITLGFNITWKAGYYFRRSTVMYTQLQNQWALHRDYLDRWQQPGDERDTQIPSMPTTVNGARDNVYAFSDQLVERGDFIRLQDVNVAYEVPSSARMPFRSLRIYGYWRSPIILWRATESGLDPERQRAEFPLPGSFSVGINVGF
ncbi:SusC/RagA family TonB-linked outer membrane protein [Parapedobacter sp. GCM10030251]|uniref:SusC/RagA family TonB-linked outer membrane protein n=1 Tax=Parapedobacter sp. GCM10030251 TaxID=3273419 RepID=UPI00361E6373